MPLVDLSGAFDLHIPSNPSLFLRSGTDIDMVRNAEALLCTAHPSQGEIFAQCLMEKGFTQEKIDRMAKENPARLLRL